VPHRPQFEANRLPRLSFLCLPHREAAVWPRGLEGFDSGSSGFPSRSKQACDNWAEAQRRDRGFLSREQNRPAVELAGRVGRVPLNHETPRPSQMGESKRSTPRKVELGRSSERVCLSGCGVRHPATSETVHAQGTVRLTYPAMTDLAPEKSFHKAATGSFSQKPHTDATVSS